MEIQKSILNQDIPDAPGLGTFAKGLKDGMDTHPEQAAQILTCMSALRDAAKKGYDSYCDICAQLDVQPVSEEKYEEHDPSIFKPLVRASLKSNLKLVTDIPDEALSGLDGLFDESLKEKNKGQFVEKAVGAILQLMGNATNDQVRGYSKLALAGLSFFRGGR